MAVKWFKEFVRKTFAPKSPAEELAKKLADSITNEPQLWEAQEFGNPFLIINGVKRRDKSMSVCVDLHGRYVRIQPSKPWGTTIRVSGFYEQYLKTSLRRFHREWEDRKASNCLHADIANPNEATSNWPAPQPITEARRSYRTPSAPGCRDQAPG